MRGGNPSFSQLLRNKHKKCERLGFPPQNKLPEGPRNAKKAKGSGFRPQNNNPRSLEEAQRPWLRPPLEPQDGPYFKLVVIKSETATSLHKNVAPDALTASFKLPDTNSLDII